MFKVIKIKNSQLYLRYIFMDNDVNLTVNNPMVYTDVDIIEKHIDKLAQLGIEAVAIELNPEEKPTEE